MEWNEMIRDLWKCGFWECTYGCNAPYLLDDYVMSVHLFGFAGKGSRKVDDQMPLRSFSSSSGDYCLAAADAVERSNTTSSESIFISNLMDDS